MEWFQLCHFEGFGHFLNMFPRKFTLLLFYYKMFIITNYFLSRKIHFREFFPFTLMELHWNIYKSIKNYFFKAWKSWMVFQLGYRLECLLIVFRSTFHHWLFTYYHLFLFLPYDWRNIQPTSKNLEDWLIDKITRTTVHRIQV